MTRTHVSHSLNRNVVPYLYTGRYMEPLTGLSQMDARWYEAETARFIQPDQYSMANLMLPPGAQSELLRYIGRNQSDLLRDPAQQMRYGYVSGNSLRWVDPLGLAKYIVNGRLHSYELEPMVIDPVLRNDINHNDISEQDAVKMAIGAAMGISNCRMNSIKVKEDTWYINLINLFGNRSAATSFNTIHINSDMLSADELFTLDNLGLAIHEVHHVINQWQGEGMTYTQYFTANNPAIGAVDYHGNNQYEAEAESVSEHYRPMVDFYTQGLM